MRRLEQCCGRGRRALGEEQKKRVEVVIVDAGCTDNTLEVVKASLASIPVTFVSASPSAGRGPALNAGVKAARGSTLLFLHADTLVPKAFDDMVRDALEGRPDMPTLLASFEFGVDRSNALARGEDLPAGLGIMQWAANVRSSLFLLPYGDQGLAMKRELLAEIGYFPNQPIMEDFEVVTRLRRRAMAGEGSVKTIPVPALCSPRRWQQNGVFMNTLLNQVFVILYVYFGASPAAVYSWYYALSPRITRWCRF